MVNLDATQRAGVFTHAGFLASYSSYNRTSPILRGAFLEKQVLCSADRGAAAGRGRHAAADATGTHQPRAGRRADRRATACAGCHAPVVNPAGFALEAYDSIGTWQTTEKGTGAAIDSTADVAIGAKTVHVTGPVDLMTQDRGLARGAELLRAAAGDVRVRARR